ncbi:hypothetical protein As57867_006732, partial [Aphanomyces stellatus]
STVMGEMHMLARGHAENETSTSPQMLAGGDNAIKSSASVLRPWTGVALPTLPHFVAIQAVGLTALSTMLVCIMILAFAAIFGITATSPQRGNTNTKTHSISAEVDIAVQSSVAAGIPIVENFVSNGASAAAGNTGLPVQGAATVVAAAPAVGRACTPAPTQPTQMRPRFTRSNSIRSPTRFSLLLGEQVCAGDGLRKHHSVRPRLTRSNSIRSPTRFSLLLGEQVGADDGLRKHHSVQVVAPVVAAVPAVGRAPTPTPTQPTQVRPR